MFLCDEKTTILFECVTSYYPNNHLFQSKFLIFLRLLLTLTDGHRFKMRNCQYILLHNQEDLPILVKAGRKIKPEA